MSARNFTPRTSVPFSLIAPNTASFDHDSMMCDRETPPSRTVNPRPNVHCPARHLAAIHLAHSRPLLHHDLWSFRAATRITRFADRAPTEASCFIKATRNKFRPTNEQHSPWVDGSNKRCSQRRPPVGREDTAKALQVPSGSAQPRHSGSRSHRQL